jgi:hypothetical protein
LFLTDPGRKILRTSPSTLVFEVVEVDATFRELFNTLESAETLFRISGTMAEGSPFSAILIFVAVLPFVKIKKYFFQILNISL